MGGYSIKICIYLGLVFEFIVNFSDDLCIITPDTNDFVDGELVELPDMSWIQAQHDILLVVMDENVSV